MSEEDAATPPYGTAMPLKARPRWRPLAIGLVIGLIIGAGGVGLAWSIADQPLSGPPADAEAACALARRTDRPQPGYQAADLIRWTTAVALAKVAADIDPQYKPLEDAISEVTNIVAMTSTAEGPDFEREVDKVRELCDNL